VFSLFSRAPFAPCTAFVISFTVFVSAILFKSPHRSLYFQNQPEASAENSRFVEISV
jgi:hypothetical protein